MGNQFCTDWLIEGRPFIDWDSHMEGIDHLEFLHKGGEVHELSDWQSGLTQEAKQRTNASINPRWLWLMLSSIP